MTWYVSITHYKVKAIKGGTRIEYDIEYDKKYLPANDQLQIIWKYSLQMNRINNKTCYGFIQIMNEIKLSYEKLKKTILWAGLCR